MDRVNAHAQPASTETPAAPNLIAIATGSSILLSGLNALLQIVKVAIELARHGS